MNNVVKDFVEGVQDGSATISGVDMDMVQEIAQALSAGEGGHLAIEDGDVRFERNEDAEAVQGGPIPRVLTNLKVTDPITRLNTILFGPRQETVRRIFPKIGRNEPCPCGSGSKYKRCCLRTIRAQREPVVELGEQKASPDCQSRHCCQIVKNIETYLEDWESRSAGELSWIGDGLNIRKIIDDGNVAGSSRKGDPEDPDLLEAIARSSGHARAVYLGEYSPEALGMSPKEGISSYRVYRTGGSVSLEEDTLDTPTLKRYGSRFLVQDPESGLWSGIDLHRVREFTESWATNAAVCFEAYDRMGGALECCMTFEDAEIIQQAWLEMGR